ncbi:hypothetical protein NECAME_18088 [Necator americanus]|uniref:Uncharacterized protein n=1 Tax=Necator americanus TaxID=51031 RepID=W2TC53_NECAM|nr:hypothetical protein NECAME_18088 [Necator americanus]ETN79635.1 hypothetical protein NECAME_18088 [Necator americanus]
MSRVYAWKISTFTKEHFFHCLRTGCKQFTPAVHQFSSLFYLMVSLGIYY